MGFRFVALDPNPECPAFYAGAEVLAAPYGDRAALAELAKRCDLVTYEFENIEVSGVEFLESRVLVPQGSRLLALSQHRIREKIILQEQGFPVTPFRIVRSVAELSVAHEALGPLMLKTVTGGYDGKGQQKITSAAAVESALPNSPEKLNLRSLRKNLWSSSGSCRWW
jgi:5-(carboxyamino)imidazole ribonucleotide synthase